MKYVILAAVLAAAVCAVGTSVAKPGDQPTYEDARSNASDAQVTAARRAYRAACERHDSTGYCECMTGGLAQALPPNELAVLTSALTAAHVSASHEARAHAEETRREIDHGCATFH
jgi:hypothetical protein